MCNRHLASDRLTETEIRNPATPYMPALINVEGEMMGGRERGSITCLAG